MSEIGARSIWYYLGVASALIYLVYFFSFEEKEFANLGMCSLVVLFLSVIILVVGRGYRFVSFPVLFSVLAWVFHFGFFPLYLFGSDDIILFNDLFFYTTHEIEETFIVCVIFYVSLVLGMTYKPKLKLQNTFYLERIKYEFSPSFNRNAWIFFAVCAVPYLYYAFMSISLGGYLAVRQNIMSGPLSYISLLLYSCAILLFQRALDKKSKITLLFLSLFFTVQIFSGQRFDAMCIEFAFILMFFRGKKFKVKTLVVSVVVAFVGLYILTIIGMYRLDFESMFSEFTNVDNLTLFWNNNPIYVFLADYGGTVASMLGSVRNYNFSNYLFGMSYVVALFHIFPFASYVFPAKYVNFINGFYASKTHALGGSFFGEAYANFGTFGIIPCFVLGIIISKLYAMENNILNKNVLLRCWTFIVYIQMFNLVRGYFKNTIFLSFWAFIVIMEISRRYNERLQGK